MWQLALLVLAVGCSGATEQTPHAANASGNGIANGDFVDGDRHWEVESFSPWWKRPFESVSNHGEDGRLCAALANGAGAAIGWPREAHPEEGLRLSVGERYRFSFTLTASVARWIAAEAKVGMVTAPYEAVLDEALAVTDSHQVFDYEFTVEEAHEAVGVVFIIQAIGGAPRTAACIDDVKLGVLPAVMGLAP